MVILFWDASALAKRYAPETGSEIVDALFLSTPTNQMISSAISYTEIFSLLLRKRNRGVINTSTFEKAIALLRSELLDDPNFILLNCDDAAFYSGISFMESYNINSTDAALLTMFLRYKHSFGQGERPKFCLVAADERLIRAAEGEGIAVLDPEALSESDVSDFLASL